MRAQINDIVTIAGEGMNTLWLVTNVRDTGVWVERIYDGYLGGWEDHRKVTIIDDPKLKTAKLNELRDQAKRQLQNVQNAKIKTAKLDQAKRRDRNAKRGKTDEG